MKVKVTGVGLYLPPKIETAEDIAPKIGKPVNWIIEKSGVSERRVSEIDVDQMGAIAGKQALGEGKKPDLIINASGYLNKLFPTHPPFISGNWGWKAFHLLAFIALVFHSLPH